jgi:chromosome segregation ATPase
MSDQISLSQQLELRDASGRTVGVYHAARVVEELTAERDRWRQEVSHLRAELLSLQRALDGARREAEESAALAAGRVRQIEQLEGLLNLLNTYLGFTPEELADLEQNGVSLAQAIDDIERSLAARQ